MCLAQGPQRIDAGEAQTTAYRSRVKHSTTEPLSHCAPIYTFCYCGVLSSEVVFRKFFFFESLILT